MLELARKVSADFAAAIEERKASTGRKAIGVMPAYFPEVLVHAAGAYPVDLFGNNLALGESDRYLQAFACTVAKSILEEQRQGKADYFDAYVFTNLCDTMQALYETYKHAVDRPSHTFYLPTTSNAKMRARFAGEEFEQAKAFLEEVTGNQVTEESFAQASSVYAKTAELIERLYALRRDNPNFISNRDFYAIITTAHTIPKDEFNRELEAFLDSVSANGGFSGPKVMVSGIVPDPRPILDLMDEAGVAIVDDDLLAANRLLGKQAPKDMSAEEIDAYLFSGAPCSCLYDESKNRHTHVAAQAKAAGATGVIFWYMKFCEPEAFDWPQLDQHLKNEGLATTGFEVEQSMQNVESVRTRLNAFFEMLED